MLVLCSISEYAEIHGCSLFQNTQAWKHELLSIKHLINMRVAVKKVVLKVYSFTALFRDD